MILGVDGHIFCCTLFLRLTLFQKVYGFFHMSVMMVLMFCYLYHINIRLFAGEVKKPSPKVYNYLVMPSGSFSYSFCGLCVLAFLLSHLMYTSKLVGIYYMCKHFKECILLCLIQELQNYHGIILGMAVAFRRAF